MIHKGIMKFKDIQPVEDKKNKMWIYKNIFQDLTL